MTDDTKLQSIKTSLMKTKKYGKQKIKTFVLKKLLSTAVLNLISNKTLNNYVFSIHT